MAFDDRLRKVMDETLGLQGRAGQFEADTPLLGALPQLDSMAVAVLLTALEQEFNIQIPDDEVDGAVFATFGSLLDLVQRLHEEQAERTVG